MKFRVVVCLLGFASLVGVTAQAQERKTIDVFAGYSYVRANPATSGILIRSRQSGYFEF